MITIIKNLLPLIAISGGFFALFLLTNHYIGLYLSFALYQFTAIKEFSKFLFLLSGLAWLGTVLIKKGKAIRLDRSLIWLFLFIIWAAFSIITTMDFPKDMSIDTFNSLYSAYFIGWNNIVQLLLVSFIFIYVYNVVNDSKKLFFIVRILIVASSAVCLISLTNYLLWLFKGLRLPLLLARGGGIMHTMNIGFAFEPLSFSNQILVALPLTLCLFLSKDKKIFPLPLLFIFIAIQLIALITTFSTGGFAAFTLSTLLLLWLLRRSIFLKRNIALFAVILVLIGALVFKLMNNPERDYINYSLYKIKFIFFNSKMVRSERGDNNAVLINMFKDSPIAGAGFGSYAYSYKFHAPSNAIDMQLPYAKPNNDWFQILGETGLVGFFLFFGFIGSIMFRAYRSLANLGSNEQRYVIGLLASSFAIWVQAVGGYYFQNSYIWAMPALLLAAMKIFSNREKLNEKLA